MHILDGLVVRIVAQLLNDRTKSLLAIDTDFVTVLDEDLSLICATMQDLGLPARMLTPRLRPLYHLQALCALLAAETDAPPRAAGLTTTASTTTGSQASQASKAAATPPGASRGGGGSETEIEEEGGAGGAGKGGGARAHVMTMAELGVDLVVGDAVVAASAGAGTVQQKVYIYMYIYRRSGAVFI